MCQLLQRLRRMKSLVTAVEGLLTAVRGANVVVQRVVSRYESKYQPF